MTYTQLFLRFLKQNNVYHLFLYNICNKKESSKLYNLYDFKSINNVLVLNFLTTPFIWNNTKQGHLFWAKLYDKWDNAIRPHVEYYTRGHDNVTDYKKIIKMLNL